MARAWLVWLGWYLLGTALAFAGLGARTAEYGWILVWGGLFAGNFGAWFSIYLFYDAAERRGDV